MSISVEQIITIVSAIFLSTGFWNLVLEVYRNKASQNTVERQALKGLLHDRIYSDCKYHIHAGFISVEDYDNLIYLYDAYRELGGNGTCQKLKTEVDKLPVNKE